MKFKLIASDMDGTILNSEHKLSQRTKDAVLRAIDAGIYFVTATGRPFRNVKLMRELLNVDMPFIVLNGASAYMGKSEKLLFQSFLSFDVASEAFDIGQSMGLSQIVYTGELLWANKFSDETSYYKKLASGIKMNVFSKFENLAEYKDCISKVLWITQPDKVSKLRLKMIDHFGDRANCFSSMPEFLEFVNPHTSKGAALKEVGKLLGIDRTEMIVFGDAYNDAPMFEYGGFSVAMGNAPDDLKGMCDHVTLSNDDDGVAVAIEEFVLSQL